MIEEKIKKPVVKKTKKTIRKPVKQIEENVIFSQVSTNNKPQGTIFGNKANLTIIALLVIVAFLGGLLINQNFLVKDTKENTAKEKSAINLEELQEEVIPEKGYKFKIKWGDLGKRMVEDGVIDKAKLAQAVTGSDNLPENLNKYIDGSDQKEIEVNADNAHFWVDVLWGLGLANKSKVLDEGPMQEGGRAANFASTGGYTLGAQDAMNYYSKYSYINLTDEQQIKIQEIASNVFRPCCGNSTAFPDCNHGMAALGLIELMVSQNIKDDDIYKTVLAFNSYWFPQTYLDIAYHFKKNDRVYKNVPAKELLSKTFSSGMGYQALKKQIGQIDWPILKKGGGCGA